MGQELSCWGLTLVDNITKVQTTNSKTIYKEGGSEVSESKVGGDQKLNGCYRITLKGSRQG